MGKCDIHIDFDKNEYPNIFVGIKAVQNSQKKPLSRMQPFSIHARGEQNGGLPKKTKLKSRLW